MTQDTKKSNKRGGSEGLLHALGAEWLRIKKKPI